MSFQKSYELMVLIALGLLGYSCVEPFEPQTVTFESALVIGATITNELKFQQVSLSRTFTFEEDALRAESNANVKIVDDSGNEFIFQESIEGIYVSTVAFAASADSDYKLEITTNDGRSYASQNAQLTAVTQIDQLYAERLTNDDGEEGVAILLNSFDPSGRSKNYRYVYEETYKIIAPNWTTKDLVVVPSGPNVPICAVEVVPREQAEQVCYTTDNSNAIILTDTNGLTEDKVDSFVVRFINRDNYIISHRYSILVKQLVQSNEAYTFFETLNSFSGAESLFSETQPGFLSGNVFSEDDPNEMVLGYFDVASVSEQRIFFNYEDLFPSEPLPPYTIPCVEVAPPLVAPGIPPKCVLSIMVEVNSVKYVNENDAPQLGEGPFLVVPRECGDCTALGGTEVPEFWEE